MVSEYFEKYPRYVSAQTGSNPHLYMGQEKLHEVICQEGVNRVVLDDTCLSLPVF